MGSQFNLTCILIEFGIGINKEFLNCKPNRTMSQNSDIIMFTPTVLVAWIAQLDPTMEIECVIQVTSSNPAGGVKN